MRLFQALAIVIVALLCTVHNSSASAVQQTSIKSLLPNTYLFDYVEVLQKTAQQLARRSRSAENIHHRHFVNDGIVNAIPTIDKELSSTLRGIETKLGRWTSLQSLDKEVNITVDPVQLHYAEITLGKYEKTGRLEANGALVMSAAEMSRLSHLATSVHDTVKEYVYHFKYDLKELSLKCSAKSVHMPEATSESARLRGLLIDLTDLIGENEVYMRVWKVKYLAQDAADRADGITAVLKQEYAAEPEPVLRLMRDVLRRAGKEPALEPPKQLPRVQTWYGRLLSAYRAPSWF